MQFSMPNLSQLMCQSPRHMLISGLAGEPHRVLTIAFVMYSRYWWRRALRRWVDFYPHGNRALGTDGKAELIPTLRFTAYACRRGW
jgi:hypothetical protein